VTLVQNHVVHVTQLRGRDHGLELEERRSRYSVQISDSRPLDSIALLNRNTKYDNASVLNQELAMKFSKKRCICADA
jgi:hypothetical protein